MAEITNTAVIGDFSVRPTQYGTDEQLATLQRYDKALGGVGHDVMHYRPASFYQIDLYVLTTANNASKDSCSFTAPWPFTVWAADVGCESAASTAGTLDILVKPSGGSFASILNAAEDVKTAAGTGQRVAPEVNSEDVAYGSEVKIRQTATSAADMIGGQAHLYCQRL